MIDEPSNLVAAFETWARRQPDAIAVRDDTGTWTYAELDVWSRTISAHLSSLGVRPGDRVGLALRSGPEAVAGVLGILMAGCCYVPMDPGYPAARITQMCADCEPSAIVVSDAVDHPVGADRVLVVPAPDARLAEHGDRVSTRDGSSVAYVMYTSGSTGRPKGVVVRDAHVLALLRSCRDMFGFAPADVWSALHSFSFDFSVWEVWGALAHGGTVVPVPAEARVRQRSLVDFLRRHGVTVLSVVPSVFRHSLSAALDPPRSWLPSLRLAVFGGEPIEYDTLHALVADDRVEVWNMYGITETTVHVTATRIVDVDALPTSATPIGRPLRHLDIRLLDEDLRVVPPGSTGEMYVGGTSVADGYLNRPELTEERFVWLSDGAAPARYFRTGDLASWSTEHDTFLYHGRADQQLKVRGVRIEPGEVEAALRAHPEVEGVAVGAVRSAVGVATLVAYVVGPDADALAGLRSWAQSVLPAHLVPVLMTIDELPTMPSGKVDRQRLFSGAP